MHIVIFEDDRWRRLAPLSLSRPVFTLATGMSNLLEKQLRHLQPTRLTLWTSIDRRYIAIGAAGWHVCFDVLDHLLSGTPLGRMAGMEVMKFDGWQRLAVEYKKQFALAGQ